MKRLFPSIFGFLVMTLLLGFTPVLAHFQLIYITNSALTTEDPAQQTLRLIFSHPFDGGPLMDMGLDATGKVLIPRQVGVLHKEQILDLLPVLKPIQFVAQEQSVVAYEIPYRFRGMGDFVFFVEPSPYYDAVEQVYLQQNTKVIINRGGADTDWQATIGLPVEILPLVKPYALWTGNVFQGLVLRKEGNIMKPVPFAEIEVEFLNYEIRGMIQSSQAKVKAPQDAFVTQVIYADQEGKFVYGLPKAGWWGFAALGVGGKSTHRGKPLSQDAVIWVEAKEMK